MADWTQTITIIGSVICTAYYIHREIKADLEAQTARIDASNTRIDQLYMMFYDLLKEVKSK